MPKDKFSVLAYCKHNATYNLATEFERMIKRAFELHKGKSMQFVADKLGITERTLYRVISHWHIERPKKEKK